jgi:hypothetical protein
MTTNIYLKIIIIKYLNDGLASLWLEFEEMMGWNIWAS